MRELDPVLHIIAVGIFLCVGNAVVVGVRVLGVRSNHVLIQIRQPVAVGIVRRIGPL